MTATLRVCPACTRPTRDVLAPAGSAEIHDGKLTVTFMVHCQHCYYVTHVDITEYEWKGGS